MANERELLSDASRRILEADKGLADQIDKLRGLVGHAEMASTVKVVQERVGGLESMGSDSALGLETIVNRVGRPVLEVKKDTYVVEGPESAIWGPRLENTPIRQAMGNVIPSVGRIEVDHHPDNLAFLGTGWLIADDIVVTNRHVAGEFAAMKFSGGVRSFVFRKGFPDTGVRMSARIDFRRELRNSDPRAFVVKEVLHIEDDGGPDFAFLKVERSGANGPLSPFLRPSKDPSEAKQMVATIGFPASNSQFPDQELMTRLFGNVYNVKRFAPGQVLKLVDDLLMHDCTTLGGNSGSPLVDLASGEVIGLHFSGIDFRENRSVPINFVTNRLDKIRNPSKPTQPEEESPLVPSPTSPRVIDVPVPVTPSSNITINVPIQFNFNFGAPPPTSTKPATIKEAVAEAREKLNLRGDILSVRDGYLFRNGWITPDPAIVVVLKDRAAGTPESVGLPPQLGGFPVDVRAASPWDIAAEMGKLESLEGVPHTSYKKPPKLKLTEVHEEMAVTIHVSPDAGWPTLREFLKGTKKSLTIGMYDFTAPHIIKGVLDAVEKDPKQLTLVMQEGEALTGKPDDVKESITIAEYEAALGNRFDHAPASIGKDRQFATAYHIKVAVRDSKAFWLSSGNWQSSNQPDHEIAVGETSPELLNDHNREWHAVIENANLAKQFEKYIEYDLKNAKIDAGLESVALPDLKFLVDDAVEEAPAKGKVKYFAPLELNRKVKVRPLLTPDNYQEHVLALIETAETELFFQNQSLSLLGPDKNGEDKNDPRFAALVDALLEKHKQGVDVRIIIRGEFAPVGPLEQLQKRGFDMSKVRLQNRCHTKGILIDGARALLGSHNWTNQGTLVNRDASLIFDDAEIAKYLRTIFLFDWENRTKQSVGVRRTRRATGDEGEESVAGMRLVSWQEIVNGD